MRGCWHNGGKRPVLKHGPVSYTLAVITLYNANVITEESSIYASVWVLSPGAQ